MKKAMGKVLHDLSLQISSEWASDILADVIRDKIKVGDEKYKLCVSLQKERCDIRTILTALFSVNQKWYEKTGFSEMTVDLSKIIEREKKHNARKAVILNAIKVLSELPRVEKGLLWAGIPDINDKLSNMQEAIRDFQTQCDKYFDYLYPPYSDAQSDDDFFSLIQKSIVFKQDLKIRKRLYDNKTKGKATQILKLKQSTHGVWNDCVVNIVNELKQRGYRNGDEFKKTAQILNVFFPDHYTDTNPRLVRKKYKPHQ